MTQIAATDTALVRLLTDCDFPGTDISSGPFEWSGAYVQKLLAAAPALRVVFLGAGEFDGDKLTTLNLKGRWAVLCVTGWQGGDEASRRLGTGAGYDLLHRAASVLHSAVLTDEVGDRLPIADVDGIEVLTDAAMEEAGLWVGAISVAVELPLELLETENCYGPLDDFLRIRGDMTQPDPAAPVELHVDLPQ